MAETGTDTNTFAALDEAEDLDDQSLVVEPQPDRLPPMLFLAALIHGIVIIGITFNAGLGEAASDAISLDVTIVADPGRSAAEADDADYLAQATREGSGNTREQVRPSSMDDSSTPIDNPGERDGTALVDTREVEQSADELLTTRREQDRNVEEDPRQEPSQEDASAIALESGAEVTLPLPQEGEVELAIYDDEPRELLTSVDTRESVVAGYLHEWKRKIEIMGIKYFPEQALAQGIAGSPTLEVTINASGELQEVILRRSSGSSILDHAAMDILRRAAPFDPFPEAIRVDYDQLRFAYKWQFSEEPAAPAGGIP